MASGCCSSRRPRSASRAPAWRRPRSLIPGAGGAVPCRRSWSNRADTASPGSWQPPGRRSLPRAGAAGTGATGGALSQRARIESVVSGLRGGVMRFLQKPGTTDLRLHQRILPEIAAQEPKLRALTDAELPAAARAAASDADICALGREAARRGLGEVPYDVQLLGTLAMLAGQVAEMATGEGKTLSGGISAAGYALRGRSVHVMSVNDYLARRDAEWMRPVYDLLGVSVGWIGQASSPQQRRRAYAAQVTYGPVSELGFDVLRDRLATSPAGLIAGAPDVALIDEADSVLVDEALVPLVLAGAADGAESDTDVAGLARSPRPGHAYAVD